jgi:hypothetical protein
MTIVAYSMDVIIANEVDMQIWAQIHIF